ncbi:putative serine protease HhoB precursor [Sporotomaculum syntrophicum]|uniref:Serine protease HhoB n=1 Tax=Sporotomaculum syntrophicum TaxID=182264 RepID=A0A9D2WMI1_9FIRM|nr:serine protease [Sporotomaculum syntrophicum]KAF1084135.1 putative serine protease HhoB precursor [Sporotomaculum syntrophicum]
MSNIRKTINDGTDYNLAQGKKANNDNIDDEYFTEDYDDHIDYIDNALLGDNYADNESNNDNENEEDIQKPNRTSLPLRMIALVTALAFLGLVMVTSWPALQEPLGDLVAQSMQLEKDIDIQRLQAAVVQINVLARKQGALASVEQKSGTGFNIDTRGIIVTNHHVIEDALNMVIRFPDGAVYKAINWVSKPEFDLAVITLQSEKLPVVPLNIEEQPTHGDRVRVVGNPLGMNNVVVEGHVEQYLMVGDKPAQVFSISAPIYPGNSGSPVFDNNGWVVGVVFGNLQRRVEGVDKVTGLAIPIQEILDLLE